MRNLFRAQLLSAHVFSLIPSFVSLDLLCHCNTLPLKDNVPDECAGFCVTSRTGLHRVYVMAIESQLSRSSCCWCPSRNLSVRSRERKSMVTLDFRCDSITAFISIFIVIFSRLPSSDSGMTARSFHLMRPTTPCLPPTSSRFILCYRRTQHLGLGISR